MVGYNNGPQKEVKNINKPKIKKIITSEGNIVGTPNSVEIVEKEGGYRQCYTLIGSVSKT